MDWALITVIAAIAGLMVVMFGLFFFPVGIWLKARFSGVWISSKDMKIMRKKKVPEKIIVRALITGRKEKVLLYTDQLVGHYLAGGDLDNLVNGLIAAKEAGLKLTFEKACAADFNDIDLVKAVTRPEHRHLYR